MTGPDHLDADRLSAPGGEPVLVVDAARWRRPRAPVQAVVIGVDEAGDLPPVVADDFDLLLTGAIAPSRPWVSLARAPGADMLATAVRQSPLAATIAARVLRMTARLSFPDALAVESFAYSTLLGGSEFARWRMGRNPGDTLRTPNDPLQIEREGDRVIVTLNDPVSRNAMSAAMRDALYEALANILDDPSRPAVTLCGAGRCFSSGGALGEFGSARDLAEAHAVRTLHSCARALDAIGERGAVRLHGACIGSGIEIAAAAHRRIAAPDAWFQLPELGMGLIPGAGGTISIARAIGRHRTLWMLLSGRRIKAPTALEWGLVHHVEEAA